MYLSQTLGEGKSSTEIWAEYFKPWRSFLSPTIDIKPNQTELAWSHDWCAVIKIYIAKPFSTFFCSASGFIVFMFPFSSVCDRLRVFILKYSQVWICPSCFSLSTFYLDVFPPAYIWSQAIQSHLHRIELRVRYTNIHIFWKNPFHSLTQLAKFKGGEFACILARC